MEMYTIMLSDMSRVAVIIATISAMQISLVIALGLSLVQLCTLSCTLTLRYCR